MTNALIGIGVVWGITGGIVAFFVLLCVMEWLQDNAPEWAQYLFIAVLITAIGATAGLLA